VALAAAESGAVALGHQGAFLVAAQVVAMEPVEQL